MFDARREDAPGFNAHRAEPPKIRLAHGAQPLVRDGGSVQFGLDATRTGIVAVERPTALASTLVTFHRPVELPEALRRLEAAGLSRAAAEVLVSDLMACGVLRVHRRATARVLLLGRSPLAEALSSLLASHGIQVRRPLAGETDVAYLIHSPARGAPVIGVDRLAHGRILAPVISRLAPTYLPVAMVDHRGWVGPLRASGRGPCPRFDHHQADRDPRCAGCGTSRARPPATPGRRTRRRGRTYPSHPARSGTSAPAGSKAPPRSPGTATARCAGRLATGKLRQNGKQLSAKFLHLNRPHPRDSEKFGRRAGLDLSYRGQGGVGEDDVRGHIHLLGLL